MEELDLDSRAGARVQPGVDPLLPELAAWNGGNGIRTLDWLSTFATSAAAYAYLRLFWPTFVAFEGYVFVEGFDVAAVRSLEAVVNSGRAMVESLVNRLDLAELFTINNNEPWTPVARRRTVVLGQTLAALYRAKLGTDFPGRRFEVEMLDGPDDGGIAVSFWQS